MTSGSVRISAGLTGSLLAPASLLVAAAATIAFAFTPSRSRGRAISSGMRSPSERAWHSWDSRCPFRRLSTGGTLRKAHGDVAPPLGLGSSGPCSAAVRSSRSLRCGSGCPALARTPPSGRLRAGHNAGRVLRRQRLTAMERNGLVLTRWVPIPKSRGRHLYLSASEAPGLDRETGLLAGIVDRRICGVPLVGSDRRRAHAPWCNWWELGLQVGDGLTHRTGA